MKEFLKSLVLPLHMRKYRHMSILIAIMIFVFTIYALLLPYKVAIKNSKEKLIDQNELNIQGLYALNNSNFDFTPIKDMNYYVKDMKLYSDSNIEDDKKVYTINYQKDDENLVLTLIFDPNNMVEEEINSISNAYKNKYGITTSSSTDEQNKAINVSKIVYVETLSNPNIDQDTRFEELKNMSSEDILEELSKYSVFDLYNVANTEEEHNYLLAFNESNMIYAGEGKTAEDLVAVTITYTNDQELYLSNQESITKFSEYIADYIMDMNINLIINRQTLNVILSILILPLVLIAIIWLFYRKAGNLKTYKEYYNIAAISSIVPTLITFVICFFWPDILNFYIIGVMVFYIFVLSKINMTPLDV